mmetsp:Transcript_5408/g.17930  ORF Transcript_5408/g.17930 Transcript_5408/m.17930 type:complete len:483 (+) Transcript_5408:76-1524(+)
MGIADALESLHLYRKVPRDLTDATRLGGAISLATAFLMAYLFLSNIAEFMSVRSSTDVALDDSTEAKMRIYFNITMERLPCQFASVDVSDVMGTSLTNVTQHIIKFKVAPEAGHRKAEYYRERDDDVEHEVLDDEEQGYLDTLPATLPQLNDHSFEQTIKSYDLVLVAFGAPWCPWSQRLDPVWRKTWELLKQKPYRDHVRIGKVDCTASDSHSTCQKHHIHAFPTIRIYRHRQVHSHENYLGNRDSAVFIEFVEEALPKHLVTGGGEAPLDADKAAAAARSVESHTLAGEGCQLTGSLEISRVPGSFRISAQSDAHSFNSRVMNVSHHVDKLLFAYTDERPAKTHKVISIEERSSLYQMGFMMHQELATLKHYLKVVPFHHHDLSGHVTQAYLYKANYNEYRPRKLEWYEGKADAHVDTQMVPNAVFHYDISPVKVVVQEESEALAAFVTKICAVIGGIYTVVGLLDSVMYHSVQSFSKKK